MIGMTNAGGGKSVGGKLTVTAPANTNVTAKLGSKAKVVNSGAGGSAVFKGLDQGSWDISIANDAQTVTIPVAITTDFFTTIAFFASRINVTYPAGSVCTCSSGNITYTATDTGGSCTFTVPKTGTWTVKITNGSSTVTKDVEITADGMSVSVTLSYWDGELFDNGNQYTEHTGGWTSDGSTGANNFSVYPNLSNYGTNCRCFVRTKNKVDVTKYNRLKFTGKFGSVSEGSVGFGLMSTAIAWNNINYVAAVQQTYNIENGVVDISAISGSYYITGHAQAFMLDGVACAASHSVSKVWME